MYSCDYSNLDRFQLNRRSVAGAGLGALALLNPVGLPSLTGSDASAQPGHQPHFLLQVFFRGGLDCSYLFDARPLKFTQSGLIQNYLCTDPEVWEDGKGGRTLVSSAASNLRDLFDGGLFSILNGVHMANNFDGHEQNIAYFATGSSTGGRLFNLELHDPTHQPLAFLLRGELSGVESESLGSGVRLEPNVGQRLGRLFSKPAVGAMGDTIDSFLRRQASSGIIGEGLFSQGSRRLVAGLDGVPSIRSKLSAVDFDLLDGGREVGLENSLSMVVDFFRQQVVQSAIIVVKHTGVDCHDVGAAQAQKDLYPEVVSDIRYLFEFLGRTPFDSRSSMLDVATVVVHSEFNRTMRQLNKPIDATATDHNELSNTILLGGRGIRKGLIIGETDLDNLETSSIRADPSGCGGSMDGQFASVSGAHSQKDPRLIKAMGKPFDHTLLKTRQDLPQHYRTTDYLNYLSIVNTLYSLWGVPTDRDLRPERLGEPAPRLPALLI